MVAANDANRPSPDEIFGCDEDDLLELLGHELIGAGAGFGAADAARYRRVATEWLDKHADELRARVVTDTAMTTLGHPTASIVAVILVRRGLQRLCSARD